MQKKRALIRKYSNRICLNCKYKKQALRGLLTTGTSEV